MMITEDIAAYAACYLKMSLDAFEHGVGPDSIETVLCEDNQSVMLMCSVPGQTLTSGFKLSQPTTEDQFYG